VVGVHTAWMEGRENDSKYSYICMYILHYCST
jgi:hypothetical protein